MNQLGFLSCECNPDHCGDWWIHCEWRLL
jgi:hypothetical protein